MLYRNIVITQVKKFPNLINCLYDEIVSVKIHISSMRQPTTSKIVSDSENNSTPICYRSGWSWKSMSCPSYWLACDFQKRWIYWVIWQDANLIIASWIPLYPLRGEPILFHRLFCKLESRQNTLSRNRRSTLMVGSRARSGRALSLKSEIKPSSEDS